MGIEHDDMVQVVGDVWQTALGLPAVPDDAPPAAPGPRVVGTVKIGGACQAEVTLDCDAALARRAAVTFFAVPDADLTREMVHDAVGELANMTGGQLKALLPEGCTLSPPSTRDDADAERPAGGVGFRAADRTFSVEVRPFGS
jgi:chemotaxis protein CheX